MKLFQYDKKVWENDETDRTWQFGVINNRSLLWVNKAMILFLVAMIAVRPDFGIVATINPAQEAAAESFCNVHGCGDQPPMDDIQS